MNHTDVSRDNHYVPQGLLRQWSRDGTYLHAYRTLVSHRDVPPWSRVTVKGMAVHRDLYTQIQDDRETDETERWFATNYEQPGIQAIERLVQGHRPSRDDWHALIRLVALQHLRTPQSFFESMQRWEASLPELIETTTKESITEYQRLKGAGLDIPTDAASANTFAGLFDVHIDPSGEGPVVRTEITLGRRFWLASIRHVITGATERLLEQQWSIWEPHDSEEWILTDDPSLRLNYLSPQQFDFGGGWGKRGSDILMPASPRHLLHTRIGFSARRRETLDLARTREVQRMLARRAYRWIFATEPQEWVKPLRPRVVDAAAFEQDRALRDAWHFEQTKAGA